jgi:hypothetical protein
VWIVHEALVLWEENGSVRLLKQGVEVVAGNCKALDYRQVKLLGGNLKREGYFRLKALTMGAVSKEDVRAFLFFLFFGDPGKHCYLIDW